VVSVLTSLFMKLLPRALAPEHTPADAYDLTFSEQQRMIAAGVPTSRWPRKAEQGVLTSPAILAHHKERTQTMRKSQKSRRQGVEKQAQGEFMTLNVRRVPSSLIRKARMQALEQGSTLREFIIAAIQQAVEK
jgi:translation elongation factor EF-1alpha